MKPPTLFVPNMPTRGLSSHHDNIAALLQAMGLLMPPGTVLEATIGHDSACPCVDSAEGLTSCLCEHVHLTLQARARAATR